MKQCADKFDLQRLEGEASGGGKRGFTLLEVVLTLAILMTMMVAVTNLMRSSFDLRFAMAQEARVTQRLDGALQRLSGDLAHAYVISAKDILRTAGKRRTVFKIDKSTSGDKLAFTFMNHRSVRKNAKEGDLSYVVYELKTSDTHPDRRHLYRGETARVPEEVWKFREQPPMQRIAEHIHTFEVEAWNGDSWGKFNWNSTSGDTRDMMPRMLRISLRGWLIDPEDAESGDEEALVPYSTVVYLPYAKELKEQKDRASSFRL